MSTLNVVRAGYIGSKEESGYSVQYGYGHEDLHTFLQERKAGDYGWISTDMGGFKHDFHWKCLEDGKPFFTNAHAAASDTPFFAKQYGEEATELLFNRHRINNDGSRDLY